MIDKIMGVVIIGGFTALGFYVFFNALMSIPQEILVSLFLLMVIWLLWIEKKRNN